ncbi:MAG: Na+/H+ antiporter NhaC family protein [Tissierellaceae bacterium]|nr:Na+/H+ antiporter NhaC family protein [Tissierellaceae bacterium]
MKNNQAGLEKKNYGGLAFLPLLVFLGVYLGAGILFTIMGTEEPFKQVPRETALIVGLIVALFMGKQSLDEKVEIFSSSAGDSGVILMCLIFLLAGAFASVAKAMGGVESTVNLGLTIIPQQFILSGVFIISLFIATAMGTSMGTIAAIGPIAIGISETTNLNPAIAIAAVVGGAMFGDNLSIISDTTIAATRGVGAEMKDKFRMNLLIALPAAIVSIIIYGIAGTAGSLEGDYPFQLIKVLPYVVVLISAIVGVNVIVVLLGGTIFAGIIGLVTGSLNIIGFSKAVASGMAGMSGLVITSLLIRGLSGIVNEYGGIDWLMTKILSRIKSRRGAEYGISALVSLIDAALANNTIAIILSAPLALEIGKKYNIARKRLASLLDIFSCVVQGFVPQGGQILLAMELAKRSPLEVIKFNYYPFLLAVFAIITIQFGLLRTKEEKEGIDQYPEEVVEISNN